jgi:Fe2+ transport system protein FeoA
MNLADVEPNRAATVSALSWTKTTTRLESVGIRVGAMIEVLGRTASRGFLVKVDDTRVVVGFEFANLIRCSYVGTE